MVGEEHAPKVTGMIIDLDPVELNMSIQQYGDLQSKVHSAMQLLVTSNLAAPINASSLPVTTPGSKASGVGGPTAAEVASSEAIGGKQENVSTV